MGSIRIFFDYIKEENKSVCRRCKEKIGGNHVTNLKKHVRTQHKEEYEEWLNKQKTEEEDNLKNKKRNREDEDAAAGSSAKKLKQGDIRSALFNEVTVKINLETIENACINLIINVHSIPPQSQHRAGLAGKYPVAPVCLSNIIFNCLIQIIVSKLIIFDCFIKIAQF